ncbi:hypothetical protein KK103_06640 [Curtobacterium flaccumfaciens pv. flaccumfaciens]|uniref:Uncharacterized protein n=1 Tax=Curtobacterium flaccumfaciens pv. flaccumfaciens TaxID=138532 RepID=A0A9Q2W2Z7_9MICO|nr:hypothetical protein [Curtobacterium flaccumfaciens]MBT1541435.1 hypothetical protein [Curtobacterium flaccumfaciens pv. flaccumfaciens]
MPTNLQRFTVPPPAPERATEILDSTLAARGLEGAVPESAVPKIAAWLGNNPRAITAFVSCLASEQLDDLLDLDRSSWELGDTTRSPQLVEHLERLFWEKTVSRLSAASLTLAENLAVFRRPFKRDAVRAAAEGVQQWENSYTILTNSFIVERSGPVSVVNPVARQLLLASLNRNDKRLRAAHARASKFFARRVSVAEPTPRALVRTGSHYLEARHHLSLIGDNALVEDLSAKLRPVLRVASRYRTIDFDSVASVKTLTATLLGILAGTDSGEPEVRAILVQLLKSRAESGDDILALHHARIATRTLTDIDLWREFVRLAAVLETPLFLERTAQRALRLPDESASRIVREIAIELLIKDDIKRGLTVLDLALETLPSRYASYLQATKGFLLEKRGETDSAIDMLRSSMRALPRGEKVNTRNFEEACLLAYRAGRRAALRDLQSIPDLDGRRGSGLVAFAKMLEQMLDDDFLGAADTGRPHLDYIAVAAQVAFCELVSGNPAAARRTVASHPISNRSFAWLVAVIALCSEEPDVYVQAISACLRRAPTESEMENATLWLDLWDVEPDRPEPYPGFNYPRLPRQLTQLRDDLIFLSQSGSRLSLVDRNAVMLPTIVSGSWADARPVRTTTGTDHDVPVINPKALIHITMQQNQGGNSVETNNNFGSAGSIGSNSTNHGNVSQSNEGGVIALAQRLEALEDLMLHARMSPPDGGRTLAALEGAKEKLEAGDEISANAGLKSITKWLGEKVSNVAVGMSAGLILKSLGY